MNKLAIDIEDELAELLCQADQQPQQAARELIVLERYRRRSISSGKAAEWLGRDREDFIRFASGLGIPYLEMNSEDWDAERTASEQL